ncbi:hypothetical protein [Pseudomonas monteilii]|uniref:hypothetical protein n=1 Tax=Pseudomonas monteilii TaxID=76759 RepID=UPI0018A64C18|nr:hypothetical protein [Pseudomonas monteilii]BBV97965.1 hypothetical protein STW0522PSE72_33160 [Pseudomonas monteilii]
MRCFICNLESTDNPFAQGGRSVDCQFCGSYSISGTALHLYRQNLWVFNVVRARDWLEMRRTLGEERPVIPAQNNLHD